jgi:hypothetical protein
MGNKLIEQKLWNVSPEKPLLKQDCEEIINYLFGSLKDYLKLPIEIIEPSAIDLNSFCCTFRSTPLGGPLRLTFLGIMGMQLIGETSIPNVQATIFLFSQGKRLVLSEPLRSIFELVYERIDDISGAWRTLGWDQDEFGEYEEIDENEFY